MNHYIIRIRIENMWVYFMMSHKYNRSLYPPVTRGFVKGNGKWFCGGAWTAIAMAMAMRYCLE